MLISSLKRPLSRRMGIYNIASRMIMKKEKRFGDTSRLEYNKKRAIIYTILRKIQHMASDKKQCIISGSAKCKEFLGLGYPAGTLRYMCAKLAYITGNTAWYSIRQSLRAIMYAHTHKTKRFSNWTYPLNLRYA